MLAVQQIQLNIPWKQNNKKQTLTLSVFRKKFPFLPMIGRISPAKQ